LKTFNKAETSAVQEDQFPALARPGQSTHVSNVDKVFGTKQESGKSSDGKKTKQKWQKLILS
jgi:hypothetical protein